MQTTTVRDLMSSEVVTLEETESLSIADHIMQLGRIRHMPVLGEGGALVGLISQRDLLFNALNGVIGCLPENRSQALDSIKVADCMNRNPHTVSGDTKLTDAAHLMFRHKLECLPVLDGNELVGILTEADFVAAFVS